MKAERTRQDGLRAGPAEKQQAPVGGQVLEESGDLETIVTRVDLPDLQRI